MTRVPTPPLTDGGTGPDAAFALVGNEIRAEILRVLGENPWEETAFSDLRARVDPEMDSGQFNYHLQKLVGPFVERSEAGYRLRPSGVTLYRTIRAGTFTRSAAVEPFDAGFACYFCETTVEGRYEDGTFELQCPGCDHVYNHTMAPPSTVEGESPATLLARIDQYNRHELLASARGVCSVCVNGLDVSLVDSSEVWSEGSEDLEVFVRSDCDHCGKSHLMSVGLALLYHPALVSFCYERGLDVTSVPHWELEFAMTDHHVTVHETDPWEVSLTVECAGDRLELTADETLEVVAEHRR